MNNSNIENNISKVITSLRYTFTKILILEISIPIIIMVTSIIIFVSEHLSGNKTALTCFMLAELYGQIFIMIVSNRLVNKILKENNLKSNKLLNKKRLNLMIIAEFSIYVILGIPIILMNSTYSFDISSIIRSFIPNIVTFSLVYIKTTSIAAKSLK